jgi:hypothetical protein
MGAAVEAEEAATAGVTMVVVAEAWAQRVARVAVRKVGKWTVST